MTMKPDDVTTLGISSYRKPKWILWLGLVTLLLYLSGFLVWLTPIPILFGYKKGGRRLGVLSILGAFSVLLILYQSIIPAVVSRLGEQALADYFFWVPGMGIGEESGWSPLIFGLSYFVFYGGMGALLGEWEPRAKNISLLVAQVTEILSIGIILLVFFKVGTQWGLLVSNLENYFSNLVDQMAKVSQVGREGSSELVFLSTYKESIIFYAVRLLPAMVLNTAIFVIWLNVIVSRKLFFKDSLFSKLGNLREWRLPFFCVWMVIGLAALLILDIYLLNIAYLKLLALNAFIVFALIYFFQGLAIVTYFGQRWALSPLIKLIFYVLFILFFQPIGILLLAFGFFDSWFDFRKLTPKATSS